jgi:hypothetical protein
MENKKITLTYSEALICKALATGTLNEEKAEAEAKGIPFDYETLKQQRERDFMRLYAEQREKARSWEDIRDKAFHFTFLYFISSTKMQNYIRDHVPNLKTLRDIDPADVLKLRGYGKKTSDDLREMQILLRHPKIYAGLNAAIEAQRRMDRFMGEHGEVIGRYLRLKDARREATNQIRARWKYYGG